MSMVFFVSYRRNLSGTKFQTNLRKTFFAVHSAEPSRNEIERLVDQVSGGEFAQSSIEVQRCVGFDPEELNRAGVTVYSFSTVPKQSASS